jgi:hypothetical protein
MDLNEMYENDDIEGDLDCIVLNSLASTIPELLTFKLLWWVQLLNHLEDLDDILYGRDAIEDDLYSILLNPIPSKIPKCRTSIILKLLRFKFVR